MGARSSAWGCKRIIQHTSAGKGSDGSGLCPKEVVFLLADKKIFLRMRVHFSPIKTYGMLSIIEGIFLGGNPWTIANRPHYTISTYLSLLLCELSVLRNAQLLSSPSPFWEPLPVPSVTGLQNTQQHPSAGPSVYVQAAVHCGCIDIQSWALEVFLNFFNNKKLFFAFLIKLIWLGVGFLNRTGAEIGYWLDKKCKKMILLFGAFQRLRVSLLEYASPLPVWAGTLQREMLRHARLVEAYKFAAPAAQCRLGAFSPER